MSFSITLLLTSVVLLIDFCSASVQSGLRKEPLAFCECFSLTRYPPTNYNSLFSVHIPDSWQQLCWLVHGKISVEIFCNLLP